MMDEFVIVLTTMPAEGDDAEALAETLVTEALAACVNLLPVMRSVYAWDGEIQRDDERQLVIKTSKARVPALWERLRDLHPYDVPEFLVLPIVDGNDAYLRWIRDCTAADDAPGQTT